MAAASSSSAGSSAVTSLRGAKRALRKEMAKKLEMIDKEEVRKQSALVTQRILASPTYRDARNVSVYVSMQSGEVDTDALCRDVLARGKRLYVPLFASQTNTPHLQAKPPSPLSSPGPGTKFATDMRMLRLSDPSDYEAMEANKWGIREPLDMYAEASGKSGPREDALDPGNQGLDLILAPGVAFDSSGGRLGHGKGYYDRYIARADALAATLSRAGPVIVALALREQLLPHDQVVPADENDRVLDAVVGPDAILQGASGRWQVDGS